MAHDIKTPESIIHQIIEDVIFWIESDLSRPMSASVVAERAGYTRWHLQKIFKDNTGMTLIHYIRLRRMTLAAQLLKMTTLSVTDIYMRVGYNDGSTFCRVFYRRFGLSPRALRASNHSFDEKMFPALNALKG
jgi:AraC-type DNA-binding domain-containing proteins